jgi:hypothetical protein
MASGMKASHLKAVVGRSLHSAGSLCGHSLGIWILECTGVDPPTQKFELGWNLQSLLIAGC